MRDARRMGCWLSVAAVLCGCASSGVSDYRPPQGHIPRPDRILVYDFAAVPSELPPPVDIAGQGISSMPLTPTQLATGRALGQAVATKLTADLQAMGLPAVRAEDQPPARVGDGLLAGYFLVIDPGNATERVMLGFGAGGAELTTVARGYLMTEDGLRALGSGQVDAGSGKMPGGAVPLVVTAITANPIGLAVGGAAKAYGELSGSETIDGAAERTAQEIADKIRLTAERQGWI